METEINASELNDLRRMNDLLQSKLDKQAIVNKDLIERIVREKSGTLSKETTILIVFTILTLPFCYWVFYSLGFSLGFRIATIAILGVSLLMSIYQQVTLIRKRKLDEDILLYAEKMQKYRRQNHLWLAIMVPVLLLWIGYFVYDNFSRSGDLHQAIALSIAGIVGGIVGAILGTVQFKRQQRMAKEIIEQIELLKKE